MVNKTNASDEAEILIGRIARHDDVPVTELVAVFERYHDAGFRDGFDKGAKAFATECLSKVIEKYTEG
jgi:hypothetical protein